MSGDAEDRVRRSVLARMAPMWLVVLIAGAGLLSALMGQTQRASDREDAIARIASVQRADCERGNELRSALRGILIRSVTAAHDAGRLTPRGRDFYRRAITDLANVDCETGRAP